jgi:hypothetical protein
MNVYITHPMEYVLHDILFDFFELSISITQEPMWGFVDLFD